MNPDSPMRTIWQPPTLEEMQTWLPQFEFLSRIGRGGMGVVYQARQRSLNRLVAVKVLLGNASADDDSSFVARFRLEAKTMAKLNHPGIVSVIDSGETQGLCYIVMEYVDGTDVARMIQAEGKLPPERVVSMLTQVCEALDYAHQNGIVHRDLKPANLLVTREGQVKIGDFGLAKQHDPTMASLTRTNVAIGTPEFIAPEAWTPEISLDRRADLYSMGVSLYQMLTGEVPRGLWKMPSVKVGTDPRFDAIVDRAMQPERESRYSTSIELRQDLERIEREPSRGGLSEPSKASNPDDTPEVLRPSRVPDARRRLRWAALLPLAVISLVVLLMMSRGFWADRGTRSGSEAKTSTLQREPSVQDAADWLLREHAAFSVRSQGREWEVVAEADLPQGPFEIVKLSLDRWISSPPLPPPPEEGFQVLRAVKTLRHVYLRLPGMTEGSLAFLAGNPELRTLTISGSDKVTDGVLAYLAHLDKLESLCISHAPRLTGRGFGDAAWLQSVREVDFLHASLKDDVIRVLSRCPHLRSVRLEGTRMTVDGLNALATSPGLVEMSVGYSRSITEEDYMEALPGFPRLRKLELVGAPVGDDAASTLASLTNLVELHLTGTQIGDEGLSAMEGMKRLKTIALSYTHVTPEGLAKFERAHPGCQILR